MIPGAIRSFGSGISHPHELESGRRRILTILALRFLVGSTASWAVSSASSADGDAQTRREHRAQDRRGPGSASIDWSGTSEHRCRPREAGRTTFNMVRPNEVIYEVVEGDSVRWRSLVSMAGNARRHRGMRA